MRESDLSRLQELVTQADQKYQQIKARLLEPSPTQELASIAQEANDAWLEFRKLQAELNNGLAFSTMIQLYGV